MLKEEIKAAVWREPFVPLRLHLSNGKTFDVPFRDVARVLSYGLLVFIGMKEGTHQSKGYDRFSFDQIVRIEQRPANGRGRRRRKAS
ncbi:MAG TPA: hypothetical protein VFC78_19495 [Tepidisphaeraceae bacterium]|nr:hypothetical protein [Tepidisphaeraceae bacterium]